MSRKKLVFSRILIFICCAFVAFGLIALGAAVYSRYDFNRYSDSVDIFIGRGIENGNCIATKGERVTLLSAYNFQSLSGVLDIYERKPLMTHPATDGLEKITVSFDPENSFEIYRVSDDGDAYLLTVFNGRKRNFYIGSAYRPFQRVEAFVKPDGQYGENELITQ